MKPWMPPALMVIVSGSGYLLFKDKPEAGEGPPPVEEFEVDPNAPKVLRTQGEDLDGLTEFVLKDWLAKSRQELAEAGAALEETIAGQEKLRQNGDLVYDFLHGARFPVATPVWRHATYDAKRDMVVPPYWKEGSYEPSLAWHLARHGDVEAARKLVDPKDEATLKRIDALALDRNYPAEWTRWVALQLHASHTSLALGNVNGAREIASIHKQLRELFDEKTSQGPLGVALLSRGKSAIQQAGLKWEKNKRQDYSEWAERTVENWGSFPAWELPKEADAAFFGGKPNDAFVAVERPRGLDLLALPFPEAGLDRSFAFFGADRKLARLALAYSPTLVDLYSPRNLDYWLHEQGVDLPGQVMIATGNPIASGLAYLHFGSELLPTQPLPRHFGALHLDRSFEVNRQLNAWWKPRGDRLVLNDAQFLAGLSQPLHGRKLDQVVVSKHATCDLIADVRLEYDQPAEQNLETWLRPLWLAYGPGNVRLTGDTSKDGYEFTWSDGPTVLRLFLPNVKNKDVGLDIRDREENPAEARLAFVPKKDADDRLERLKDQKHICRLPRQVEMFSVGQTRAEAERAVPQEPHIHKFALADGILWTFNPTSLPATADSVLRQAVVRFEKDKVAEIRVRYSDRPGSKVSTLGKRIEALKSAAGPGLPAAVDNPWSDVSNYQFQEWSWQDDVTQAFARLEPMGLEIVVRDVPAHHPKGTPLEQLQHVTRGPAGVLVGTPKAKILADNPKASTLEGALVIASTDPLFDTYLVYFEDDRVSRVVARHRYKKDEVRTNANASEKLVRSWTGQLAQLGWPWMQEAVGPDIKSWGTLDGRTRYRVFWQPTSNGIQVFSEWKDVKRGG